MTWVTSLSFVRLVAVVSHAPAIRTGAPIAFSGRPAIEADTGSFRRAPWCDIHSRAQICGKPSYFAGSLKMMRAASALVASYDLRFTLVPHRLSPLSRQN
jgi:hypothetical protein